jgi:hypothetical protein
VRGKGSNGSSAAAESFRSRAALLTSLPSNGTLSVGGNRAALTAMLEAAKAMPDLLLARRVAMAQRLIGAGEGRGSRFTLVAPAVLAMAAAAPCVAQDLTMPGYITGDRLIKECRSVVQRDSALCIGYIIGVSDAMQAAQDTGGSLFGWQACLPPGTTAEQVTKAAVRFLIAHPEAQPSSASGIIAKALSDAFPCHPG